MEAKYDDIVEISDFYSADRVAWMCFEKEFAEEIVHRYNAFAGCKSDVPKGAVAKLVDKVSTLLGVLAYMSSVNPIHTEPVRAALAPFKE